MEKQYLKQNSVIFLKSNFLALPIFGLATLPRMLFMGHVITLVTKK